MRNREEKPAGTNRSIDPLESNDYCVSWFFVFHASSLSFTL